MTTFFVYGALYVNFWYTSLVFQGVLGYTATGAALIGLPTGVMLALLSTRIGTLAGRLGARRFLVAGPSPDGHRAPLVLASPGQFGAVEGRHRAPSTLVPPVDVLIDVLPAVLLFGLGISCVVAPLTSTLMGSISTRFSGLGSAINNSISRVGQPLLGAFIFIAVSATFYATLGALAPTLDTSSAAVQAAFQPLNPPPPGATPEPGQREATADIDGRVPPRDARVRRSCSLIGAVISFVGLRERRGRVREAEAGDAVDSPVRVPVGCPDPRPGDAVSAGSRNAPPWPGMTMSATARTRARPASMADWSSPSGSISGVRSARHHRWVSA